MRVITSQDGRRKAFFFEEVPFKAVHVPILSAVGAGPGPGGCSAALLRLGCCMRVHDGVSRKKKELKGIFCSCTHIHQLFKLKRTDKVVLGLVLLLIQSRRERERAKTLEEKFTSKTYFLFSMKSLENKSYSLFFLHFLRETAAQHV